MDYIAFERPIVELEEQILDLRRISAAKAVDFGSEIRELEAKSQHLRQKIFATLEPYEVAQLSRHPKRPHSRDFMRYICSPFIELHGDRAFYDDKAIVGGLASIGGENVVIMGHQKGRGTRANIEHNFGMAKPEGYRKALRLMRMAEQFGRPLITLIDTPGADPGVGAEERGQSEAIARCILEMSRLTVPVISFVTGEGGSGGALALGVANRVHMLQYSVYSVISPEGCASILMKDASQADKMAKSLQLTASSALEWKIIDSIIEEPEGGAHRRPDVMSMRIREVIAADLNALKKLSRDQLKNMRMEKFLSIGAL